MRVLSLRVPPTASAADDAAASTTTAEEVEEEGGCVRASWRACQAWPNSLSRSKADEVVVEAPSGVVSRQPRVFHGLPRVQGREQSIGKHWTKTSCRRNEGGMKEE